MCVVSTFITKLCDMVLSPFSGFAPVWGIAFCSLLTAFFILSVYKLVSHQAAITRLKKRIQGYFLGIYLFRDNLSQILVCQWKVVTNVLRYMGHAVLPLAVVIVPITLLCVQMQMRYGYSGPEPCGSVLVTARLTPGGGASVMDARIETSNGLEVETPPLRIASLNEVEWEVTAGSPGDQTVKISADGSEVAATVSVGRTVRSRHPVVAKASFLHCLLNPGGKTIDAGSAIQCVRIDYSPAKVSLAGFGLHWSIVYFLFAILFGLIFKKAFKVEF